MLNNTVALLESGAAAAVGDYESIQTFTVGAGGTASVEFTSIPQTYKHLQIRLIARTNRSVTADNVALTFNGDTLGTTNYGYHLLAGDGATASAGAGSNFTWILGANVPGASSTASVFGAGIIDILDYTNTNKNRVTRSLTGYDANGSGNMRFYSGLYRSTTAVTSIKLWAEATFLHTQYSSFALYGVK
jgi:hypothetical protein